MTMYQIDGDGIERWAEEHERGVVVRQPAGVTLGDGFTQQNLLPRVVLRGEIVIDDPRDLLVIGPLGTRDDYLTVTFKPQLRITTGCFSGSVEQFETLCRRKNRFDYLMAIRLIRVRAAMLEGAVFAVGGTDPVAVEGHQHTATEMPSDQELRAEVIRDLQERGASVPEARLAQEAQEAVRGLAAQEVLEAVELLRIHRRAFHLPAPGDRQSAPDGGPTTVAPSEVSADVTPGGIAINYRRGCVALVTLATIVRPPRLVGWAGEAQPSDGLEGGGLAADLLADGTGPQSGFSS
jgi:hypothetical protein